MPHSQKPVSVDGTVRRGGGDAEKACSVATTTWTERTDPPEKKGTKHEQRASSPMRELISEGRRGLSIRIREKSPTAPWPILSRDGDRRSVKKVEKAFSPTRAGFGRATCTQERSTPVPADSVKMLHPTPAPRTGLASRKSRIRRHRDVHLSLSKTILSCKEDTGESLWSLDLPNCSVEYVSKKNEVVLRKDRWHEKICIDDDKEYKDWVALIRYAAAWQFDTYYDLLHAIGEGGFGKVYKCRCKTTKTEYACKVVEVEDMSHLEVKLVCQEIETLSHLDHESFVKIYDVFEEPSRKRIYIVMELIRGGDLFGLLEERQKISEMETQQIVLQLCQALHHMHLKGFMHRDLKPENIMLVDKASLRIKLIDFGLSERIEKGEKGTVILKGTGTTGYMAPEIIVCEPHNDAVDMWAVGCIIFMLLSGTMPFTTRLANQRKISLRSVNAQFEFNPYDWVGVSREARSLVTMLLQVKAHKRPPARVAMEHHWFRKPVTKGLAERPTPMRKLRRAVWALMFLFSWSVELDDRKLVLLSPRSAGPIKRSVTEIYARNTAKAE